MFVCLFWIRNRICPTGSISKGGPTENSPTFQDTRYPRALSFFMFPVPPPPFVMHPASGLSCTYILTREIHPLDPQPHRHSMLVPRVCAPRVTWCGLGKYWSRDWFRGNFSLTQGLWNQQAANPGVHTCYLWLIVVWGSEIWWCMHSAHSLSTTLRSLPSLWSVPSLSSCRTHIFKPHKNEPIYLNPSTLQTPHINSICVQHVVVVIHVPPMAMGWVAPWWTSTWFKNLTTSSRSLSNIVSSLIDSVGLSKVLKTSSNFWQKSTPKSVSMTSCA